MEKFEKQLPEALDLIARALRAGHAFTSGMKLAADEFEDPLGPYFLETLDEINFGLSVADKQAGIWPKLSRAWPISFGNDSNSGERFKRSLPKGG